MNALASHSISVRSTLSDCTIEYLPGLGSVIPAAHLVLPSWRSGLEPVVCVHGIRREAGRMAQLMSRSAEMSGRVLVVPQFDSDNFRRYQRAVCRDRSDRALLRLMKGLQEDGVIPGGKFDLAGFSGGAQFAHRFTWFYPNHVGRLRIASAGWYTFPDDAAFPYGMGGGLVDAIDTGFCLRSNFEAFVDRDIIVRVGENDNVVDDKTRSGASINAQQGLDRLSRARNWVASMNAAAERLNIAKRVDFHQLNGCGHSFEECVTKGKVDMVFLGLQG